MERQLEYGKEVHICFIDYSKAFDCINHELLWKTLLEMLLNTLYSFHNNYFNLVLSSFCALGSRQLVCIAYYLVLSFLLMYSSRGLSTDVFPNKKNINKHEVTAT